MKTQPKSCIHPDHVDGVTCGDPKVLCERCSYDQIEDVSIPDIWADRYQGLCKCCADDGYRIQAKLDS